MIMKIQGVPVLAVLALAACGGGGGSGGQSASSYSALVASERSFIAERTADDDLLDNLTPVRQMPSSGTATYRGAGTVRLDRTSINSSPDAAGQATLRANFSSSRVTGEVTNFRPGPGHSTAGGTLNVSGDIDGNWVFGDVSGAVFVDGVRHGINTDEAEGAFVDRNAGGLIVEADGYTSQGNDYLLVITSERN